VSKYPVVSIVTVVYNSVANIEATIRNVLDLSYPELQYVVIDGGSTDGTLDVIEKYKSQIEIVISEPDKGIYDAMNKSVNYCRGEWIGFMNSGDIYNSTSTLDEIFQNDPPDKDEVLIYGKHKVAYGKKLVLKPSRPITDLWKGMTIQHQSIFVRKSILEQFPFNTNYKFAADYDLVYNCYRRGFGIRFVDLFISIVSANGVSESNSIKTYTEFKKIALHYESDNRRIQRHYIYIIIKRQIISKVKSNLPFLDKIRLYLK
jgi:glycosyltransferase involved in cell wall biosynthesis